MSNNNENILISFTLISTIFSFILLAFCIYFLVGTTREPIAMELITTNMEYSQGDIDFKETIETSDTEIIRNSSKANNFIKYAIGIAVILIALVITITILIKTIRRNPKK